MPVAVTSKPDDVADDGFGLSTLGDLKALSTPPKFSTVEEERKHIKERLAAAFRIFAKHDFDHHVVSIFHIARTMSLSYPLIRLDISLCATPVTNTCSGSTPSGLHLLVSSEFYRAYGPNPAEYCDIVMTVHDLILVNYEGEVVGGGRPGRRAVNRAGFQVCYTL